MTASKRSALITLSIWLGCGDAAPAHSTTPPRVVRVESGQLTGVARGTSQAFLGVPYAAAPVGANRWRAPQPLASWAGIRPAATFGASCMQPFPAQSFGPYTREFVDTPPVSEDCLYLNVWRPAAAARRLPVLVWIHGGAFLGGSGAVPIYDGAALAGRGAVIVTINYRVGPFGFLAHPELSAESAQHTSGNYGLLDQIAALRWVQRNIGAFGGDARNVTIAGQSAGAASVNDLLIAPAARGLFQRAVSQSGSGMGVGAPTLAEAERRGLTLAAYLDAADIAGLRALPADRIQAAVVMPLAAPAASGGPPPLRFQPVCEGQILPFDPDDPAARVASQVPLISGYTADENLDNSAVGANEFIRMLRTRYGASAERLLSLYPHGSDTEAADSARLLARDRYMASLVLWSQNRTAQGVTPIYLYRFDHAVPVTQAPSFGAFHTAEVPYLFGVLDAALRPYDEADHRVSALVQDYWLQFMRTGDPNGPGLPHWDRFKLNDTTVLSLGTESGMRPAVSTRERFGALRDYVMTGGTLSLF